QDIINTQQPEIELMQKWIADIEANESTNDELSENDDMSESIKSNENEALSKTEVGAQSSVS
ncbi:MAG: DUF305 domain-containing protein, partial [Psychrobacter sp.]|nr:DUF305 domain-containing protein [Psychrobacter sp.]